MVPFLALEDLDVDSLDYLGQTSYQLCLPFLVEGERASSVAQDFDEACLRISLQIHGKVVAEDGAGIHDLYSPSPLPPSSLRSREGRDCIQGSFERDLNLWPRGWMHPAQMRGSPLKIKLTERMHWADRMLISPCRLSEVAQRKLLCLVKHFVVGLHVHNHSLGRRALDLSISS